MFELSDLDSISFVKNLKIYEISKKDLIPSVILNLLKRNTKFVQRKKFNEIKIKIEVVDANPNGGTSILKD